MSDTNSDKKSPKTKKVAPKTSEKSKSKVEKVSKAAATPAKSVKEEKKVTSQPKPVVEAKVEKPKAEPKTEPESEAPKTSFWSYVVGLAILILIVLAVLLLPQQFAGTSEAVHATITYGNQTYELLDSEVDRYMVIADAEGFDLTREQMAEQLSNLNILLLEAQAQGFTTDSEAITNQISQFDVLIDEQMSNENLTKALAERGFTKEEFVAELRTSLAKDLVIQQLLNQEVYEKYAPTQDDLKQIYEQNKASFAVGDTVSARHILICHNESVRCESNRTKTEALAFTNAILADIKAGDISFEDAAKQYSDGPSGSRGGDLGAFGAGQMVPSFEQAAFAAEIGDVTEVVETDFGYHLITVYDKAEGSVASFEQVEAQLEQIYQQDVLTAKEQAYVQSVLDGANVEYAEE